MSAYDGWGGSGLFGEVGKWNIHLSSKKKHRFWCNKKQKNWDFDKCPHRHNFPDSWMALLQNPIRADKKCCYVSNRAHKKFPSSANRQEDCRLRITCCPKDHNSETHCPHICALNLKKYLSLMLRNLYCDQELTIGSDPTSCRQVYPGWEWCLSG